MDRLTSAGRLTDTADRVARALVQRPLVALALRSLQRYIAIDGTQRGLVLAGQAFSAVIPLLIVLATLVSSNGGERLAQRINDRFGLEGNSAEAVRTLFSQPPGAVQSVTFGSVLLLVISGLSCARTMQRSYEAAWQLPPRGLRGTVGGAGALALLLTQILLLSLLAGFLRQVPAGSVLEFVVRAAASSALWLALQHLLLGGRVAWRPLLPGAIAAGVGQQGVAALSTLWIPRVVQNNATRYGAIGVSFALLSWLVLISIVLVVAAALSVELGHGPPLPVPEPGQRPGLFGTLARLLGADDLPAEAPAEDRGGPDGEGVDLVVLGFPSRDEAEAVLAGPPVRAGEDVLGLRDGALVWRSADGALTVQQAYSPQAAAPDGGAPWSSLLGVLFRVPAFGLTDATATSTPSDAAARTLAGLGIDEAFSARVAAGLTPGAAAVFVVVPRRPREAAEAMRAAGSATVVRTPLAVRDTSELARRLEEAHRSVRRSIHPG